MKTKMTLVRIALTLSLSTIPSLAAPPAPEERPAPCEFIDYGDGCYGFIAPDGTGVLSDDIQEISDAYAAYGCMD